MTRRRGFTLIELIVVMALLSALLAASAPTLSRFFHGRSMDEEALRFLSLTRYAASEAASRSIPLSLWIDPVRKGYGLEAQPGYEEDGFQPFAYQMDENLSVEIEPRNALQNGMARIRFTPGGLSESDVEWVRFYREGEPGLWIVKKIAGPEYEILKEADVRERQAFQ
ncbi:MAG: prepilin-type N-terminal cleavage/methylation domain-containing protein [bacterium]|nr:prepilin-type N-terminal cleavage/methylation domain-containing protein [bacterium]